MFTLAISCLTTSNLACFKDLTFQVPMQYCSSQHQTLLLSPVISTTGCVFGLAPPIHSFWSYFSTVLQQHIGHLLTWGVQLLVSCLFAFLVLEKTLESLLDSKGIQPVHPKGNQSCIFIGRTDVEAETPILWPPDVKN